MDYEKKYKEAINRAKAMVKVANSQEEIYNSVITIFPELKESEDEKIRKGLIKALSSIGKRNWGGIDVFESIAWLEKQDNTNKEYWRGYREGKKEILDKYSELEKQNEQKPVIEMITPEESLGIDSETYNDIVNACIFGENKPKFKVGDWIVNKLGNIWHIDSFDAKNYQVTTTKGEHNYFPINIQDRMHIWTIADAKDGDVLCTPNGNTFIFKTIDGDKILDYCGLYFNKFFSDCGSPNGSSTHYDKCNYHPATKEQRNLLFQKMKEAGYEWDAENKELKKIEQKSAEWSEEDDWIKTKIIKVLLGCETFLTSEETNECIDWIKSIKQRLKGKS